MKNRPNFLIVGAAKAGTTSLHHYLSQHPDVFLPQKKECKFFSGNLNNQGPGDETRNARRTRSWEEYLSLFENAKPSHIAVGEATPDYLYYSNVSISSIKHYLGEDVKIIIILRNPIERAFSAYLHHRRDLVEELTFRQALEEEELRIANNYAFLWHYKSAGLYHDAVKDYVEAFANTKIFLFDELKNDAPGLLREVEEYLGISHYQNYNFEIKNESGEPSNKLIYKLVNTNYNFKSFFKTIIPKFLKSKVKGSLKSNLKKVRPDLQDVAILREYYKADVELLSELTGKDLTFWLQDEKVI